MRYITLTDALKHEALVKFQEQLDNDRFSQNRITFSFDLKAQTAVDNKVIVNIRPEAWLKMWSLVHSESGEIGWHATVKRHADKLFEITDIVLYPQFVTGTTVTTDDVGYANWLHRELDDETFNHLRCHGHSHVNMSATPSGVDTTWYNEILQGLDNNDYYIFMILNKKENYFIEIYDLANNAIFEKDDITINVILSDNNYLNNWITQSKERALQQKHNPIGFNTTTNRLENVLNHTNKQADEDAFNDMLMSFTEEDMVDKELTKAILDVLQRRSYQTGYFGLGYYGYVKLNDYDKIKAAQNWYSRPSLANKPKKGKKGKPQLSILEEWGDGYDQYY